MNAIDQSPFCVFVGVFKQFTYRLLKIMRVMVMWEAYMYFYFSFFFNQTVKFMKFLLWSSERFQDTGSMLANYSVLYEYILPSKGFNWHF
jgi:integral membrane sensor domain MASE1